MIVLSGANLVLPDRIVSPGTIVIEGDRITDIRAGTFSGAHSAVPFALHHHYILPGLIDTHVHGVDGVDTLDAGDAVRSMAAALPRYGVTAFCPTTVACAADRLRRVLEQIRRARAEPTENGARVLPAHLESNFINPEYRGAQPADCLCSPRRALHAHDMHVDDDGAEVLQEIERGAPDVGIVTLAPEMEGGDDLIRWLIAGGQRVSLGHSAASYEQAIAAISLGARRATHLFNRMPPLGHRTPGLAGAVLASEEVAAEVICDGVHVHRALLRATIAAKRASRVIAITDGTSLAGRGGSSPALLGGRPIVSDGTASRFDDGTLAGSVLTMDGALRFLVEEVGVSLVDGAAMCAMTPARELGLVGCGVLAEGALADVIVLDARLQVVQTYVGGRLVYTRSA
jgi:N-acetylglucosamine-6-phosphate deacetylase